MGVSETLSCVVSFPVQKLYKPKPQSFVCRYVHTGNLPVSLVPLPITGVHGGLEREPPAGGRGSAPVLAVGESVYKAEVCSLSQRLLVQRWGVRGVNHIVPVHLASKAEPADASGILPEEGDVTKPLVVGSQVGPQQPPIGRGHAEAAP